MSVMQIWPGDTTAPRSPIVSINSNLLPTIHVALVPTAPLLTSTTGAISPFAMENVRATWSNLTLHDATHDLPATIKTATKLA